MNKAYWGDRLNLLIRDQHGNRFTGLEFKVELVTARDFGKGFEQAGKYLTMLQLDVYLVNFVP